MTPAHAAPTRLRRWAWRLSDPRLALLLLGLIFAYLAVGSAGFPLRQQLELSEMAWFNGPVSVALWLALCACLTMASLVRIPWTWRRTGAHLTHAGVLSLTAASMWYFAGKIEGETLLLRGLVEARTAAGAARLLPDPGASTQLGDLTLRVDSIMPEWAVRTGAGAGGAEANARQAWAVLVTLTFAGAAPFTATLLEGHPELTQYTLQGRQPQSWLPEFAAVAATTEGVSALDASGAALLHAPLAIGARDAHGARTLEITGLTADWPLLAEGFAGRKGTMVAWKLVGEGGTTSGSSIVGEPTLTRFQQARVKRVPDARLLALTLAPAPTAVAYRVDRPALWVRRSGEDPGDPRRSGGAALPMRGLPRYHDHGRHVGGAPLAIDLGMVDGVSYRVTGFAPYATLETALIEDPAAAAMPTLDLAVTSETSGQRFPVAVRASVDPAAIDDQPTVWLRAADAAAAEAARARLAERFPKVEHEQETLSDDEAARTRLVFLSEPSGAMTLWIGEVGRTLTSHPLALGGEIAARWSNERIRIWLRAIVEHPRSRSQPVPVPPQLRRSRATVGDSESWVEITATASGGGQAATWLPYTPYPDLPVFQGDPAGTLGAFAPRPVTLAVPGGGEVELEYAREAFALPGAVWMTGFRVPRRAGGDDPAEFFCDVRHAGDAGEANEIHLNHPLPWNDLFLFQAQWDPRYQALSVLGVGNRPGGGWMLASAIAIAIGMTLAGVDAARRREA